MELRRPIPARLLADGEGSVGGNAEGLERYLWVALVGVEAAGVEVPAAEQRWRRE